MDLSISVDSAAVEKAIAAFQQTLEHPDPLLQEVAGPGIVHAVDKHFDEQGPGWKELSPLTLMNRRGGEGQILRDTDRLMNSIHANAPFGGQIIVAPSTEVIYAALQNFGGTITPKNAPALRVPAGPGRFLKLQSVTIPARPFMYLGDNDVEDITSSIADYLRAQWEAA